MSRVGDVKSPIRYRAGGAFLPVSESEKSNAAGAWRKWLGIFGGSLLLVGMHAQCEIDGRAI